MTYTNSAGSAAVPHVQRSRRSIGLAAAVLLLVLPEAGRAQDVMSFIDRDNQGIQMGSAADSLFVLEFAREAGVDMQPTLEIPYCQYRSPLRRTRGGYVDGALDWPTWGFYIRAPFPKSGTDLRGLTLTRRPEFPEIAYLELEADLTDRNEIEWVSASILFPPVSKQGALLTHFSHASLAADDFELEGPHIINAPPGLPSRIVIPHYMIPDILVGLERSGTFEVEMSYLPTSDALAPGFSLEGPFGNLAADIADVRRHLLEMQRREARGECKVLDSECKDGSCGQ